MLFVFLSKPVKNTVSDGLWKFMVIHMKRQRTTYGDLIKRGLHITITFQERNGGDPINYDLVVDSSCGINNTCEKIITFLKNNY